MATLRRTSKETVAKKPKRKQAAQVVQADDLEWSSKELKEKLHSFHELFGRIQRIPKPSRRLLATIVERMDMYAVPRKEIEHVTGYYDRDFYDEFEILSYHKLAAIEDDGYIRLASRDRETWQDFRYYCETKGINLAELVRNLDLNLLEQ